MFEYDSKLISINESRLLFDEVMVNFYSENYRSCINNLNSLLYFDLVKKLQELRDNYNDEKSKTILEEVKVSTNDDEKYSKSELRLLELCKERNFIDNHFYEEAINLRKVRNHCSHPAFYDEKLFSPSKLEVQMYIDLVFNNLLILNSINYYGSVDYVLEDIKNAYDRGISASNDSLKERAKRLFDKLDKKNKQKVFNSLFELSVIKNTEDCRKYRDYTYNYMIYLLEVAKLNGDILSKEIVKKINISHLDEQYFSTNTYVAKIVTDDVITLNDIENYNPEINSLYRDFLTNSSEINNVYNQIFGNLDNYVEYVIGKGFGYRKAKSVLDHIEQAHSKKYFYKLLDKIITNTPTFNSFDLGDYCLDQFCTYFDLLEYDQARDLLLKMNSNNQIISSSKNHDTEHKKQIVDLFKSSDYKKLIADLKLEIEENEIFF